MKSIVETIYDAQKGAYEIPKVTETHHAFDIPEAYRLQAELVARYVSEGSRIIGYKMGLTSREKMEQMGVDAPVHGVLFEEMLLPDGVVRFDELIHPKAEPEVAVRFAKDVPPAATAEELRACIGHIAPAIDIIDSRYLDFKFTMEDVVADNCSSAQFAVGEWIPYDPSATDLAAIRAALEINGGTRSEGISSAVLGSPLTALQELHRSLAEGGETLKKDQIVLTGAITAASLFVKGDTVINKTDIGEVALR